MKTTKTLFLVSLFALGLSSCADKMTDQHSSMVGGDQTVKAPEHVTPANTDGTGKPMGGETAKPAAKSADSTHTESAPASKPF